MTDPRNIAHDKKVQQEKKHHHEEISPGAEHAVQPGRKPHMAPKPDAVVTDTDGAAAPDTQTTP
ncbi:hypothetical protein ACFPOE_15345 [Caenimonas terrae]|uniref:Sigma-like protein n=1 Tax=Caenimonas terrae TaxID=696074 RepID=A0ABW0NIH3_9BURK